MKTTITEIYAQCVTHCHVTRGATPRIEQVRITYRYIPATGDWPADIALVDVCDATRACIDDIVDADELDAILGDLLMQHIAGRIAA